MNLVLVGLPVYLTVALSGACQDVSGQLHWHCCVIYMVNLRIATLGLPKNGGGNNPEMSFEKFLDKLSPQLCDWSAKKTRAWCDFDL